MPQPTFIIHGFVSDSRPTVKGCAIFYFKIRTLTMLWQLSKRMSNMSNSSNLLNRILTNYELLEKRELVADDSSLPTDEEVACKV